MLRSSNLKEARIGESSWSGFVAYASSPLETTAASNCNAKNNLGIFHGQERICYDFSNRVTSLFQILDMGSAMNDASEILQNKNVQFAEVASHTR